MGMQFVAFLDKALRHAYMVLQRERDRERCVCGLSDMRGALEGGSEQSSQRLDPAISRLRAIKSNAQG
jgi:hypothetical protein